MGSLFRFFRNNIVIIFTMMFLAIFKITSEILIKNELMYREWVRIFAIIIISAGIIIWTYQLLLKMKKHKILFVVLNILFLLVLIAYMFVAYVVYNFYYHQEYVMEIEGKKYVVHCISKSKNAVCYYEYQGPFFMSIYETDIERHGRDSFFDL